MGLKETNTDICGLIEAITARGGRARLTVRGSSMFPALVDQDSLLIEKAEAGTLSAGMVILARRGNRLVAHRLKSVIGTPGEGHLITRGDNRSEDDPRVAHDDVIGRVAAVERRGVMLAVPQRSLVSGAFAAGSAALRAIRRITQRPLLDGPRSFYFVSQGGSLDPSRT